MFRIRPALLVLAFGAWGGRDARAQQQAWIVQLGTAAPDSAESACADDVGGLFVGGSTYGTLGFPNAGSADAWLQRRDGAGALLWTRQFGSSAYDGILACASDGGGGVYAAGFTGGALGGASAGFQDAWLAAYDGAGVLRWIRQWGSSAGDEATAACPDGSAGVYVAGFTSGNLGGPLGGPSDPWIARLDGAGNTLWLRQFGSAADEAAWGVAQDGAGGVFITGSVTPSSGPTSSFLARFDGAGTELWRVPLGAGGPADLVTSCAAEDGSGGVFVAGSESLGLDGDIWIARHDGAGNALWVRRLGTTRYDFATALLADGLGGARVAGSTEGNLGAPSAGVRDAWVAAYDGGGVRRWLLQYGSSAMDWATAAAADGSGGTFLVGRTDGDLGAPSAGSTDAWIARHGPGPLSYCTAKTNSLGCVPAIEASGVPSASAGAGFVVACAEVRNHKPGLLFHTVGKGRGNLPFQCGILCVGPSGLQRTPGRHSGGSAPPANDCTGVLAIDMNSFAAGLLGGSPDPGLGIPGALVHAQWWGRDQGFAPPCNTLLSDALAYAVGS